MINVATKTLSHLLADFFRRNVRAILAEQGMTNRELADRLNCAPNHITQTLSSDSPDVRLSTVERWALALDVDNPLSLLENPDS